MTPPKVLSFRRFKKLFKRYNIEVRPGKKHPILCAADGRKYPIPNLKDGDDIEKAYTDGARRKFGLTPEDGVSDAEFYQ